MSSSTNFACRSFRFLFLFWARFFLSVTTKVKSRNTTSNGGTRSESSEGLPSDARMELLILTEEFTLALVAVDLLPTAEWVECRMEDIAAADLEGLPSTLQGNSN